MQRPASGCVRSHSSRSGPGPLCPSQQPGSQMVLIHGYCWAPSCCSVFPPRLLASIGSVASSRHLTADATLSSRGRVACQSARPVSGFRTVARVESLGITTLMQHLLSLVVAPQHSQMNWHLGPTFRALHGLVVSMFLIISLSS